MIELVDVSTFFYSYPGMYLAQSIFHSLIAAIIVDRSLNIWKIADPLIKQKFRYIVILVPIFSFPIYQIINPDRGTIIFRLGTLLDINRWLNLELWGQIPLSIFFILILLVTAMIFLMQELIPVLRHTSASKEAETEWEKTEDPIVSKVLESLTAEKPEVFKTTDDNLVLFSTTGKEASIFLSTGLINTLGMEQLQAAIAHEVAHISRNKKPSLLIIFFLRIFMFFNPVVLLEFRRIVQEEEKICDDIAVSLTKKPHALAETLKKLYYEKTDSSDAAQLKHISNLKSSIEEYSHNMQIKDRVMRLEQWPVHNTDGARLKFLVTFLVIMALNYFIV